LVADEAARDAAREILAGTRFTRWSEDYEAWLRLLERLGELVPDWLLDVGVWLKDAVQAIFSALGRFLSLFGIFGDVGEGIGWIAACLIVAAAVVLVWGWREVRQRQTRPPAALRSSGHLHADALREARVLAGQGQYLEAAHRVQLATLAMLIEFDWLELARSDPNRTLRDRVRNSRLPERERGQLVSLVDRLERLWFNEPEDDPVLFEDWIRLDERLASLATGGRS
jgi:hypothetical protein